MPFRGMHLHFSKHSLLILFAKLNTSGEILLIANNLSSELLSRSIIKQENKFHFLYTPDNIYEHCLFYLVINDPINKHNVTNYRQINHNNFEPIWDYMEVWLSCCLCSLHVFALDVLCRGKSPLQCPVANTTCRYVIRLLLHILLLFGCMWRLAIIYATLL